MWGKFIVQIVTAGVQVVGRAFTKALRQEFQSAAHAKHAAGGGKEGAKKAATNSLLGMTEQEAKQILNVQELDAEKIQKSFEYLFKINEKTTGGSFYLQSKVYRAKERLDSELQPETPIEPPEEEKEKKENGT